MKRVLGIVAMVLLAGWLYVSIRHGQDVRDWWELRSYTPSAEIASLAANTTMSDEGRTLFYVHDPQIEDAANFNKDCDTGEATIVLGCYDGKGIYLFEVADERLDGIHEVTAAHEMLHAAYDRLSAKERAEVDRLTMNELAKLSDPRMLKVIAAYRERDASVVPNELHSIFATELRVISPELESYYRRYFRDRASVVAFSEKYERVFTDITNQVERYDAELRLIKSKVDTLESSLTADANDITRARAELDRLLKQNNTAAYNDRVPGFNASVEAYNASVGQYKALIAEYNQKVEERNRITLEQNQLVESLNSRAQEL